MTFLVKDDPERMNVIQAIFNENIASLTQSRIDTIVQSLDLLLNNRGKYKVKIIRLFPEADTSKVIKKLTFRWLKTFLTFLQTMPSSSSW